MIQTQIIKDCAEGCAQCTSEDSCLKCQNDELFVDRSDGVCKFCIPGQFFNQTSGTCENCKCYNSNENRCFTQEFCPVCPVGQYLNLDTFQCSSSCPVGLDMIVIENHTAVKDNVAYCRGELIYVDPTSLSALELGTFKNPYKCSRKAIQELYNYLPGETKPYQILIKEGTFSVLRLYVAQNFIVGAFNLTISTYSANNQSELGPQATIHMKSDERLRLDNIVRDKQFILKGGYDGSQIECQISKHNFYKGQLLIIMEKQSGLQLQQIQKSQILCLSLIILMKALCCCLIVHQQHTVRPGDKAFARQEDTSRNILTIDSTSLCPIDSDNITKNLIVKNLYISSDAHTMDSAVNYQIIFAQKSDLNKRPIICQYENITTANLYSLTTVSTINAGLANLTAKNILYKNVSTQSGQYFHFQLSGSNHLQVVNFTMADLMTSARVTMILMKNKTLTVCLKLEVYHLLLQQQ
eukprot:403360219